MIILLNNNEVNSFLLLNQGSECRLLMKGGVHLSNVGVQTPSLSFITHVHYFRGSGVVISSRNKFKVPICTYNNHIYTCLRLKLGSMSMSTTRTNSAEVPRRAALRSKLLGKRLFPA